MKDDMLHLAYVSLGEHRGHRRLWLEGRRLEDAGFGPATRYAAILDAAAGRIRLVARPDGDRMVSQRQREGGVCRPIVDLANALLDRVLGDRRRARVAYAPGEIEITIHHLDRRAEARAAKLALGNEAGVEVFCPMLGFERARKSGRVRVVEAMFPGYLFARFFYEEKHRLVGTSNGVSAIVSFGGSPAVVPEAVINELRASVADGETVEIPTSLSVGEEVQMVEGPFQGLRAMVTGVMPARAP